MVDFKNLQPYTRRVTIFTIQQKIAHIHRSLTEHHLTDPPQEIYQSKLSDIYPENIDFWFKPMIHILGKYTGTYLKIQRTLSPGKSEPIDTLMIIATTETDLRIVAYYVRMLHSFIKTEARYKKKVYATNKRKDRRKVKRGTRKEKSKLYKLSANKFMTTHRAWVLRKVKLYLEYYLIENQEEIFTEAILIRNQKLGILRNKKRNNPLWKRLTP